MPTRLRLKIVDSIAPFFKFKPTESNDNNINMNNV